MENDERLLEMYDCSLTASEYQPEYEESGELGSFDPFAVGTPTLRSVYPFVDRSKNIIGGP